MRRSASAGAAADPIPAVRTVHFPGHDGSFDVKVYDRSALRPGTRLAGPVIIRDPETSSVVGPDCTVTVDPFGGLSLELAYPEDGR
jgi:N-methylhydantoinase A